MTRVAVVGLGLIGGSAALAFEARGWDLDPAARRRAAARGINVADELGRAVDGADVVLLAVPSAEVPGALVLASKAAPSAILTDAASWKRPALQAAERLPDTVRYVAGHPMAGAAASGASARPDLFAGRPWLLVPTVRSDAEAIDLLTSLVRGIGAVPRVVDAELHDAAMTWVSHLPLAVASALAQVIVEGTSSEALAFAGPGVLDTTRLAGTPRDLALELALADAEKLAATLERFSSEMQGLIGGLRRRDAREIERFFEEARAARKRMESESTSPDRRTHS